MSPAAILWDEWQELKMNKYGAKSHAYWGIFCILAWLECRWITFIKYQWLPVESYLFVFGLDAVLLAVEEIDGSLVIVLQWCTHHQLTEAVAIQVWKSGRGRAKPGILGLFWWCKSPVWYKWALQNREKKTRKYSLKRLCLESNASILTIMLSHDLVASKPSQTIQ